MKKNNKGFSLVELIVVVLILGILAVAVTPQIMNWVDKSKENTDKSNVESIEVAAQAAVMDYMEEKSVVAETIDLKFNSGALVSPADGANSGLAAMVVAAVGDVAAPKTSGKTYYEVKVEATSGQVTVTLK